jgi:hypothetical protein
MSTSTITYKYPRDQYFFDLSGVTCKSSGDIIKMRNMWNVFERVENFNDVIYQRFLGGFFDQQYYKFADSKELNDYRVGQALHIQRYSWLDPITFDSISNRPMPSVPVIVGLSEFTQVARCIKPPTTITQKEATEQQSDLAIYVHVSTFNNDHVYKYNFANMDEQLAYHRAERRILFPSQ